MVRFMALTPLALASAAGALRVADDDAAVEAHFTSLSNSWNKATLSVERESKQEGRFLGLSKVVNPLQIIDGTGCWCNFSPNTVMSGHGATVSKVDQLCQTLNQAYRCVIDDVEAETGDACVPWETSYEMFWYPDMPNHEILSTCQFLNSGASSCLLKSCYVEYYFLTNLWKLKESIGADAWKVLGENKHPAFDPKVECSIASSGNGRGQVETLCCGDYPVRFPYRSLDGVRKCCGDKVYSSDLLTCCDEKTSDISLTCN